MRRSTTSLRRSWLRWWPSASSVDKEAKLLAVHQERVELIERRKRRRAARKTKKRRKKKLPRSGGACRPHRQWHVRYAGFAGSDAPRGQLRGTSPRLLDKVVYVPVMQIVQVRHLTCCGAEGFFFMVQTVQEIMDAPRLLVDMVVNAPIMQVVQVVRVSQVLVAKITVVIPQLQHVVKSSGVGEVVHMPVVCNDRSSTSGSCRSGCLPWSRFMQTIVIPRLPSIDKVVDVPNRAGSSGASVVETLVLSQLQIVETTVVIPDGVGMPVGVPTSGCSSTG